MQLVRTTIRLREALKKAAERIALEEDTTLQNIFNDALEAYLQDQGRKKAKKIIFGNHSLGADLDNLTRDDYYPDPDVS
ncbi:MAG: hypothetical protein ACRDE5_19065 [Ginsengibacter sp.]